MVKPYRLADLEIRYNVTNRHVNALSACSYNMQMLVTVCRLQSPAG